MSKPGGWPGTCTGGKVILEAETEGDTKAEVDGKDFCNPWKFAQVAEVLEPLAAFDVKEAGADCETK